jgi:hypothetical protein
VRLAQADALARRAAEGDSGRGPIPPGGGGRVSVFETGVTHARGRWVEPVRDVWSLGANPRSGRAAGGPARPGSKEPSPRFVRVLRRGMPEWSQSSAVSCMGGQLGKVEAPPDTLSITGINGQRYLVSRDGPRWKTQGVLRSDVDPEILHTTALRECLHGW